jgi:hypothetical protein
MPMSRRCGNNHDVVGKGFMYHGPIRDENICQVYACENSTRRVYEYIDDCMLDI